MEISDLPGRFKISVIKKLTKVRRAIHEQVRISVGLENIKKNQIEITELKTTIIELKNPIEGFDIRLDQLEKRIRELEGKAVVFI